MYRGIRRSIPPTPPSRSPSPRARVSGGAAGHPFAAQPGRPPGFANVTDGFRRMRRSPVPFWVVTVVAALIGARAIRTAGVDRATPFGPLRSAVVVTRAVQSGATLTARDVRVDMIPSRFVPVKPAATVGAVLGRAVRTDLAAGQAVNLDILTPQPAGALAVLAGPGRVVLAVATTAESLPLRVGDRVAVMVTVDGSDTAVRITDDGVVCERTDRRVSISVDESEAADVAGALTSGVVTLVLLGA
jgi:SAF domain